uniref:Kelch repeat-containing protein n=1 Tax=Rhabditophanes sp. KR3021 TaxID=114890 RepID=A0AC35U1C6_9BILA
MTAPVSGSLNSSIRNIFKTNAFYIPNSAKKTSAAEIADEGFNSGGDTMVNVEGKSEKKHSEEIEKLSNFALTNLKDEELGQHDSSQLNDDINTSQLFNDSTEYDNSVFEKSTSSENDSQNDEAAQNALHNGSNENDVNSGITQGASDNGIIVNPYEGDVSERFDDINDENDILAAVINANRSFCVSKKSKTKLSARLSSSFSKFTSFINEKRRKKGKELEVKKPKSDHEAFTDEAMTKESTKNDYSYQINQTCVSPLDNYFGEQSNLGGSSQRFGVGLSNGSNFKYTGQLHAGLSPILESPARLSHLFFDNKSETVNLEGRFSQNKSFELGGLSNKNSIVCVDLNSRAAEEVAKLVEDRECHACGRIGNKVFNFGGLNNLKIEKFDIETNTTETLDFEMNLPTKYPSCAVVEGRIFSIGGFAGGNIVSSVDYFESEKMSWIKSVDLVAPVQKHKSVVIEGVIYVTGGEGCSNIQRFDEREGRWTLLREDPLKSFDAAVSTSNNNILCCGGEIEDSVKDECRIYELSTNSWRAIAIGGLSNKNSIVCVDLNSRAAEEVAKLVEDRECHACGRIGNKVFNFGGLNNLKIEKFDIETNTTETLDFEMNLPTKYPSCAVVEGRIFSIVGFAGGNIVSSVDYFESEKMSWIKSVDLVAPVQKHKSVVIEGVIYVTGGEGCSNIQRFDEREGRWTLLREDPLKSFDAAVSTSNNNILCCGGEIEDLVKDECRIYELSTNSWRTIASLPLTLISASSVETKHANLILGGWQKSGTISDIYSYIKSENMSRLLSGGYQHEPEKIGQSIHNLETRIREMKYIIEETLNQLSLAQHNVKYEDIMGLMTSLANAVSQVQKLLKRSALDGNMDDEGAYLSNHVLAPQFISMDFDADLYHKSEGRIPYWNHDVLPDYLRTKLMPTPEEEEQAIEDEIASKQVDYVGKQILAMTKNFESMLSAISEGNKCAAEVSLEKMTSNPAETRRMVMAVMHGTELIPEKPVTDKDTAPKEGALGNGSCFD